MDDDINVYKSKRRNTRKSKRRNTRKSRRRNTRKSRRRNTRKSRRRNTRKSRRRNTRKSKRRNTRKSRRRNTRKSRRRNTYKKNNKGKSTPPGAAAAVAAGETPPGAAAVAAGGVTPPPPVGIGVLSDDTIPEGDILRFFESRGIVIPEEIYIDFDDTLVPWEKMKDGVEKELDIPVGALIENKKIPPETLACKRLEGFEEVEGFEGQLEIKKVPVGADVLAEEIKKKNPHLVNFVRYCLDQGKQVNIVSFNDHYIKLIEDLMKELFKVEGEPESVSKGRADSIVIVNKNTFIRYCGGDAPPSSQFKKRAHIALAILLRNGEIVDPSDDHGNYAKILQGANKMKMEDKLLIEDSVDNVSKHQGPCILFEIKRPFIVKYLPKGGDWEESDMSAFGASGGRSGRSGRSGRRRAMDMSGLGMGLNYSPAVRDTDASGDRREMDMSAKMDRGAKMDMSEKMDMSAKMDTSALSDLRDSPVVRDTYASVASGMSLPYSPDIRTGALFSPGSAGSGSVRSFGSGSGPGSTGSSVRPFDLGPGSVTDTPRVEGGRRSSKKLRSE